MMGRNQMFVDPTFLLDDKTYKNIISNGKAKTNGIEIFVSIFMD